MIILKEVPLWFVKESHPVLYKKAVKNILAEECEVDDNMCLNMCTHGKGFNWHISPEGGNYWDKQNDNLKLLYKKYTENIDNYSVF